MAPLRQELRERFPLGRCPRAVEDLLRADDGDRPWALACSGGPDSLFLLYWWAAHFPGRVPRTRVLHFDHRVRPHGAKEAARVRSWAEGEGFPCAVGSRAETGPAPEAELRAARFAFFGRELQVSPPCRHLLVGHNRDDAVETLLLRLARGSHPEGLAAPRAVARHRTPFPHWRLRPLLGWSAAEIRAFLRERGVEPTYDSSNDGLGPERNRIRHQVLPAWEAALGREAAAGLLRSQEELAEWADHFAEEAEPFLAGAGAAEAGEELRVGELRGRSPALRRFVLQRIFAQWEQPVAPAVVDSLVATLGRGGDGRWSVAGGSRLHLEGDWLRREQSSEVPVGWASVTWPPSVQLHGPDGDRLDRRKLSNAEPAADLRQADPGREAFLGVRGDPLLRVRRWEAGDRYRPLGAPGTRKLQDLFTDRRIDRLVRRLLPVVEIPGQGIVWVPGLPPAEPFRVDRGHASVLHLTYRPPSRS